MEFTKEDVERVFSTNIYKKSPKAYYIKINNKIFKTFKGKIAWSKKSYAIAALRNDIKEYIKLVVFSKLSSQGYPSHEIYSKEYYRNAFNIFYKYLEDNKLIEIVEVDLK